MPEETPDIVNPSLPLKTDAGNEVIITHTYRHASGQKPWMYEGVIKRAPGKYMMEAWDYLGNPRSRKADRRLKNVPGFKCCTVYLNVYEDHSTGYGYLSEEMAQKYALSDARCKVVARVEQTITFKES